LICRSKTSNQSRCASASIKKQPRTIKTRKTRGTACEANKCTEMPSVTATLKFLLRGRVVAVGFCLLKLDGFEKTAAILVLNNSLSTLKTRRASFRLVRDMRVGVYSRPNKNRDPRKEGTTNTYVNHGKHAVSHPILYGSLRSRIHIIQTTCPHKYLEGSSAKGHFLCRKVNIRCPARHQSMDRVPMVRDIWRPFARITIVELLEDEGWRCLSPFH
jgi:hypothetical protein